MGYVVVWVGIRQDTCMFKFPLPLIVIDSKNMFMWLSIAHKRDLKNTLSKSLSMEEKNFVKCSTITVLVRKSNERTVENTKMNSKWNDWYEVF